MSEAVPVVFPKIVAGSADDMCVYPLKILRYADADVLLATGTTPGQGCHGCEASLSAYVLQRLPDRSRVAARFVDFGSAGTFGDPGEVNAIQFAGHDAISVEAGGTFQGYSASNLQLFVFRGGGLESLEPYLPLSADNEGAMTDGKRGVSVEATWHVMPEHPDEIVIDYKVTGHDGRVRRSTVVWVLAGTKLVVRAGRVPPEIAEAAGQ